MRVRAAGFGVVLEGQADDVRSPVDDTPGLVPREAMLLHRRVGVNQAVALEPAGERKQERDAAANALRGVEQGTAIHEEDVAAAYAQRGYDRATGRRDLRRDAGVLQRELFQ